MAESSVTGTGKLMEFSTEPGSYSYVVNTVDNAADPSDTEKIISMQVTVNYTDIRETRKWYNLTESAIDTYIAANPTAAVQASLQNEFMDDTYEMTVTTVTRTIVSASTTNISEPE